MTKSFSSPPSGWSVSSIDSTLAGVGLFVATAAVSQFIQIRHASRLQQQQEQQKKQQERQATASKRHWRRLRRRRRDASRSRSSCSCSEDWCNGNTSEEPDNNIISKQAFRRRRLSRRLSFQEFEDGTVTTTTPQSQRNNCNSSNSTEGESDAQQSRGHSSQPPLESSVVNPVESEETEAITEWSIHHSTTDLTVILPPEPEPLPTEASGQQQKGTQPFPRDREEGSKAPSVNNSSVLNNRYHDFHPKYQNWRHFEHYNEHDQAKQRRKAQLQQQQQQQEQQDAGEGASQKEDEKTTKRQSFRKMKFEGTIDAKPKSIPQHCRHHRDRFSGIDEESVGTSFENENDNNESGNCNNDDSLGSGASVGSGNSFKSACSFESNHSRHANPETVPNEKTTARDAFGPQSLDASLNANRLAVRSGGSVETLDDIIEAMGSGSYANDADDAANDVGKFQRFYRMLSRSIIDDDSDQIVGSSEHVRGLSLTSGPTNSSSSSSSRSSSSRSSSSSIDYDGDIEDRHRALRTEYNAQIMPEKLVLIRHGQSMGNVDETFYATTPDNAMPLTDLGWAQARKAGTILKDKIITPGESVHFIVSPYVRTVETFHGIVSAWCDPESEEFASIQDHNQKVNAWYERLTELGLTWNEDSRIREQDFGNYQNPDQTRRAKEERHRFGAFYYRFQNGESGSDVYDRVSTFLDSLWRSFETNKSQNYVLVTHGIVLRVLMARYFRYTISQLNMLANPRNCEMVVLGHAGDGRLDLEGRCSLELEEDPNTRKPCVKGYKFHKRLRIFPKSQIRTVQFRISPLDQKV
jgi:broad specificity phosphatase PhoE